MDSKTLRALEEFRQSQVSTLGALGVCLLLTRKAQAAEGPLLLDPKKILSPGGGQVAGLSGIRINEILEEHGIQGRVGTEAGRTSRGTPEIAKAYAQWVNQHLSASALKEIETWWIARFNEHFSTAPFELKYDANKSLAQIINALLDQAIQRQNKSPGKKYAGAMLQHLTGAKLELAVPNANIQHHGFEVADAVTGRRGDFEIDGMVIHCTTFAASPLMGKCAENLRDGCKPLILTVPKYLTAAQNLVVDHELKGVEVFDAIQFLAANLLELGGFRVSERRPTVDRLIQRYNEIVLQVESDRSLLIKTPG